MQSSVLGRPGTSGAFDILNAQRIEECVPCIITCEHIGASVYKIATYNGSTSAFQKCPYRVLHRLSAHSSFATRDFLARK